MNEADTQAWLASYIRRAYPNVLFHSDFGSGVKLTIGQARKQKIQNGGRRAWPDMFIAQPSWRSRNDGNRHYCGLFLELKKDGTHLKKKNGEWINDHIAEQAEILSQLERIGYKAEFAIGIDEAIYIIDDYLCGGIIKR